MINLNLYLLIGIIIALLSLKPNKVFIGLLVIYWLLFSLWSIGLINLFAIKDVIWSQYFEVSFSYHIDDLARLFSLLISGIGVLVFLYSAIYMQNNLQKLGRLSAILQLFAISMLLLVLTDNMIVLFLAWEMTTITSYLLIQFSMENKQANQMAFNGMFVSVLGALCMLCGFILLHQMTGTWSIQSTIQQVTFAKPYYIIAFILLLLGAITKSAQFPFHFWLPGAMQAPTPVSAYLHSATMVNAGIYLLARFHPLFSNLSYWYTLLSFFGLATMLVASVASVFQRDLKAILAYTTLFILGSMVYLLAANDIYAAEAFVVLLFFHALYKAAAFMWVGAIDKSYGTRDLYHLAGQGKKWPLASAILIILMAAMAGLPPLFGFAVKEMIYEAKLSAPSISYWKMSLSIIASVLIATVSLRIVFIWLFGQPKLITVKRLPLGMLCPLLLAIIVVIISFVQPSLKSIMHEIATNIVTSPVYETKIAVGSTRLALLTVFAGFMVIFVLRFIPVGEWPERLKATSVFQATISLLLQLGNFLTRITQGQSLTRQLAIIMTALLLLIIYLFIRFGIHISLSLQLEEHISTTVSCAILIVAAMILLINKHFILNMVCFAVFGFAMSAIFVIQGAPDVAMAQLLIEILTVIILIIALQFSNVVIPQIKFKSYLIKFMIATPLAMSLMALFIAILQKPLNLNLSDYFIKNGLTLAHGKNVVNLILIDYRALDTFGEVLVVVATAFAIWLLINNKTKANKIGLEH